MKKLFVCSEFYAGQLPFGSSIVNTMRSKDTFGVFVCTPKCNYRKTIIPNEGNYIFVDFPATPLKKILHIIYPYRLIKIIDQLCRQNDIRIIHSLTIDTSLAFYLIRLQQRASVYYTVHDLFFHEKIYKYLSVSIWRDMLDKIRIFYLIKHTKNLVTCSQEQYRWMLHNLTGKHIYIHNFPTLVTETIKSGSATVPELKGIKNYILFFGLIERYKGVDILYNTYIHSNENTRDKPLVIAGKGNIYFERDMAREHNVIFINRYIDDTEVKELYANAFCVALPYISGTQSGILSLSYYFKVPAIVSNIPFFKTMMIDNVTATCFDLEDPNSLLKKIYKMDTFTRARIVKEGYAYYRDTYDEEALKSQLIQFYDNNTIHEQTSHCYSGI